MTEPKFPPAINSKTSNNNDSKMHLDEITKMSVKTSTGARKIKQSNHGDSEKKFKKNKIQSAKQRRGSTPYDRSEVMLGNSSTKQNKKMQQTADGLRSGGYKNSAGFANLTVSTGKTTTTNVDLG